MGHVISLVRATSKAATSSHAVQNLPEYQSSFRKRVSGLVSGSARDEVAAFRWMIGSGLT